MRLKWGQGALPLMLPLFHLVPKECTHNNAQVAKILFVYGRLVFFRSNHTSYLKAARIISSHSDTLINPWIYPASPT